jgi:hypothetical protein
MSVEDDTYAMCVGNLATKGKSVNNRNVLPVPKHWKFLHSFAWLSHINNNFYNLTARFTTFDPPLPRPPTEEFENSAAMETIQDHPDLFVARSPINVNTFEHLLSSHPNHAFVNQVCVALQEGFWPWAHTQKETYPVTWNHSSRLPKSEAEAEFLREQRDVEVQVKRYSESFRKELLPGMYSTPIHTVPKPHSVKLWLVNDHSTGEYSLNSIIVRDHIMGCRLDTVSDLVNALLRDHQNHGNRKLILFKSDVAMAYCHLILHPIWQIKQIVTVDGERHVDRCTSFDG